VKHKSNVIVFVMGLFLFFSPVVSRAGHQSWNSFLKQLRIEALSQGIRPDVFDQAFQGMKEPSHKVIHYDRTQPEKRLTFLKYRNTRADAFRIKMGRIELKKNHSLLTKIGREYGVNECFIVSLWGLETSYGRFMGTFPVVHSLATLAYDNRRANFFRKQLFLALKILNEGHVNLEKFKGEWAGASGHPQFLPSSFHHYAVDYDGDGKKDIWTSLPDVFASIANYLHRNGWKPGEAWALPVVLPSHFNKDLINLKITKSVNEWKRLGVYGEGEALPSHDYQASIIAPYGGPAFMIFNNFKVIMKWNRSTYYAGTVGYMAEKICQHPIR